MVKVYHRPEPPPPDVDSNRAVRRTETFLNREASAGLFQRALVKAEGHEQAVEQSTLAASGLEHQMESDAESIFGAKSGASLNDVYSDNALNKEGAEPGEAQVEDTAEHLDASDIAASEESTEVDDLDDVDSAEQNETDAESAESTPGFDANAAYQMFDNIRDLNNSSEPASHTDSNAAGDSANNEHDVNTTVQPAMAHAASTSVTLESRVESLSSMSDLIDVLESSSQLPTSNEWTLILEDDGPVSELTLSSDAEGRWNIGLRTSFDNESVDDDMMNKLRNQLDTAGVAVATIALVDNTPSDLSASNQTDNTDSGSSSSL